VDSATQITLRAVFAFLTLGCFVLAYARADVAAGLRTARIPMLVVSVCTAVASGAFMVALGRTSVAHVLLFQAISPIIAAVLGVKVLGELLTPRICAAMVLALVGVGVMVGGPGGGNLTGDALALLMAVAFAVVIVVSRRHRAVSMAPAACMAQLLLLLVATPLSDLGSVRAGDVLWSFLLGAGQLGLGLAAFTVSARLIPAAELAVITLLEVVLGPVWVWIGAGERPSVATLAGGAIVIGAVVVQSVGSSNRIGDLGHARWRPRR
jgi:drug/metabolite transporter (DMT)-like permease